MAKKKAEPIEEIKVEEAVIESVAETEKAEDDSVEKFINAQLININQMDDRAKAKRLAKRVLRNRKG